MKNITETKFIREYRRSLKIMYPDIFVHKMPGGGFSSGLPDLYICDRGKSIWMEVKIHIGQRDFDIQNLMTAQQKTVARDLQRAGALVYICAVCNDTAIITDVHDEPEYMSYDINKSIVRLLGGIWGGNLLE